MLSLHLIQQKSSKKEIAEEEGEGGMLEKMGVAALRVKSSETLRWPELRACASDTSSCWGFSLVMQAGSGKKGYMAHA